jgi:DNA topoisomerase-1
MSGPAEPEDQQASAPSSAARTIRNAATPAPSASRTARGEASRGDRELGVDPKSGQPVTLKNGRFGPYVETPPGATSPSARPCPRAGRRRPWTLEQALRLLEPAARGRGKHPEDGKPIQAGLGRYGPFVLHAGTYANLGDIDEVFDVGLNRAVALPKSARAERAAAPPPPRWPKSGRFGPTSSTGRPTPTSRAGGIRWKSPLRKPSVLIAERVAKGGGKKPVKKAAPKKAAAPKKPDPLTANTVKAKKKAPAKKKPAAKAKAPAE